MTQKECFVHACDAWVKNDVEKLLSCLGDEIIYMESWGPVYRGKKDIREWFEAFHLRHKVLRWNVLDAIDANQQGTYRWEFEVMDLQSNVQTILDGCSITSFDEQSKISIIREYVRTIPMYLRWEGKGEFKDEE